jgi:hypothetical protein
VPILLRLLLIFIILSLTACSSSEELYLEGLVTDRTKKSMDVELIGTNSYNTKNITVNVKHSHMISNVDEGEIILVKYKGINWWLRPPEAEAITVDTFGLTSQ